MNQSTETSPVDEEGRNDVSQTQVQEAQFDLSLPVPPQPDQPVPTSIQELQLAERHDEVDAQAAVPTTDPVSLKPGQKIMLKLGEIGDHGIGWKELELVSRCRKGKDARIKDQSKAKTIWWKVKHDGSVSTVDLKGSGLIWKKKDSESVHDDTNNTMFVTGDEVHEVYACKVPYNQHYLPHVKQAKAKEAETLKEFETYEEIPESELNDEQKMNVIRSTWVVVMKQLLGETICKARICARGDMEIIKVKTDAPTIAKLSARLLLSVVASKKWKLSSLDFKAAFLQSPVDREVVVIPPHDLIKYKDGSRILWRLKKRMYGLVDASRGFWLELDRFLISVGCQRSIFDKALYFYYVDGALSGIIETHVDDLCFAGDSTFHEKVIKGIIERFTIGRVEVENFTFTGWNLRQDKDGITLTQDSYVEKLSKEDFSAMTCPGQMKHEILDEAGQSLFRKAVGSIGWVSQVTRPDLSWMYVHLSTKSGKATVEDARKAERVVRKIPESKQTIRFSNLGNIENVNIYGAADSSWGKLNNFETVIGHFLFLAGENGKCNVLDWSSNKLQIPSASPLAAESEAALDLYGRVKYARAMLVNMLQIDKIFKDSVMIKINTDSKSLKKAVDSDNSLKDKRTAIAVATLRRCVEFENMQVRWVKGQLQIADLMTKEGVNPNLVASILRGDALLP
jgi:hypothetical protein